jgi:hypothetical protein
MDGELRGMDADGNSTRARGTVISEQGALAPLIQAAL